MLEFKLKNEISLAYRTFTVNCRDKRSVLSLFGCIKGFSVHPSIY